MNFSESERRAIQERKKELAAEQKRDKKRNDGLEDVLAAFEAMPSLDRRAGLKIHTIVSELAPFLWPKLWYGMPAYSIEGKKILCFFQSREKGESRYATFGFTDVASLDKSNMWASSYALLAIGETEETRIRGLIKQAISDL